MTTGRDKNIDIKEAREKMLQSLKQERVNNASQKKKAFFGIFGNSLEEEIDKSNKGVLVEKESLKVARIAEQEKKKLMLKKKEHEIIEQKRIGLLKSEQENRLAKKREEEAKRHQLLILKEKAEKEKNEVTRKERARVQKEAEERVHHEKELLKNKLEEVKKKGLLEAIRSKEEARKIEKKKKEQVLLKKSEEKRRSKEEKAKVIKKHKENISKSFSSFFAKRKQIKADKLEQKRKLEEEREKFSSALKQIKKEDTPKTPKSNEGKKESDGKSPELVLAWTSFTRALQGKQPISAGSQAGDEKSKITAQKLHYIQLEKESREKKKKEGQGLSESFSFIAKDKAVESKKDDLAAHLFKLNEKELEKKNLIVKKESFWTKVTQGDIKENKEKEQKEAKEDLDKKAEIKGKEVEKDKKTREKELKKIKWVNPGILKANLVKGEEVAYVNWTKNIILMLLGIGISVTIIGVEYSRIVSMEKGQQTTDNAMLEKISITGKKIDLAKKNIEQIAVFQKKMELVTGLLKNHIYWTNFFKFLEGEISNNVYIEGFSGTSAGQYTLSAKARDFNTIAEQIKSLRKNEYVVDVSTGGGTVTKSEVNDSEIVSFNLSLKVDQKLFQK